MVYIPSLSVFTVSALFFGAFSGDDDEVSVELRSFMRLSKWHDFPNQKSENTNNQIDSSRMHTARLETVHTSVYISCHHQMLLRGGAGGWQRSQNE